MTSLAFAKKVTVMVTEFVPFAGSLGFVFVSCAAPQNIPKTTKKNSSASLVRTYARGCNLARRLRVVMAETNPPMKTNFLIIATLAGLVATASAASNQTDTEILVLPAYVVTAPRYLPAELKVNTGLKEFCLRAIAPSALAPDLNLLRAHAAKPVTLAHATKVSAAKPQAKS